MATEKDIAEQLIDDIFKHTVELQKISNHVDGKLLKELSDLTEELTVIAGKGDFSLNVNPRKRRDMLNKIIKRSRKAIDKSMNSVAATVIRELGKVGKLEAQFALSGLNRSVTGSGRIVFATKQIGSKKISRVAKGLIIKGTPQKELWARQTKNLKNKFSDAIRQGWVGQEDIPTIANRIRGTAALGYKDGIMNVTKRQAVALARTSIASVANQTREEVYLANRDVISGRQYLVVEDDRVTKHICAPRRGETFYMDSSGGFEVGSSGHYYQPPPLHYNCRTTIVPIVKTPSELSSNKLKTVPTSKRSSLGKAVKTPKDADSWLKTQDTPYQKEVLGKAYSGWKKGTLSFDRFVTQKGKSISTSQLHRIYRNVGKI